jgi:hypothetical protein
VKRHTPPGYRPVPPAWPADFGGPILFAYLMPPNSPDLLRYVNYWLTLEDTEKSAKKLTDYWLKWLPWAGETPPLECHPQRSALDRLRSVAAH